GRAWKPESGFQVARAANPRHERKPPHPYRSVDASRRRADARTAAMSKRIPLDEVDDQGNSFYVSERKIYPRDVSGRFNRLRVAAVVWLLGMFYVFPWLRWDGRQAVLFDLPARKFYVFGLAFWPQDFLFLALLLIIAAF